ncbi:hypothetical protein DNI29_19005 [Hymenobacter sediminis]|uniref:phage antirepressor KilAC domain-containing protein n=1 Tax=Hymenobacter sediminis TaxID=2218621 RepID=UPI000DA6C134|nr:phage antirepressor KilAC domain-containing protein [Hymenobacter sediminis]RPD45471.1 hypothetical protein DNI29_19005 [Hymenobacter sediminis]
MEAMQITLADGRLTHADKLQAYFSRIFQAEDSGQEFPVDLSHVWSIGYSRKDAAVRALQTKFEEGTDYQSFHRIVERETGASTEEVYQLTVSCAEYFVVRANRLVFEVYRACRKAVRQIVAASVPKDFASALRLAADLEEQKQRLTLKIEQDAPKVAFAEHVAISNNSLSFTEAAKWLKIPGVGRNKLIAMLRRDKILMKNREPYQQHINAGYFEVEPQTYEAGEKGRRMAGTTRVTPKGMEWLVKRYKSE